MTTVAVSIASINPKDTIGGRYCETVTFEIYDSFSETRIKLKFKTDPQLQSLDARVESARRQLARFAASLHQAAARNSN